MASPLDISNLPPDIKRIILRMEELQMMKIRQISPSWNEIVVGYLNEGRNKLPLERVRLQSGVADFTARDEENSEDAKKLLHMHAVIPDRCKGRVGFGKWLKAHKTFHGATEVTCQPQKVILNARELRKANVKSRTAFCTIMIICISLTIAIFDVVGGSMFAAVVIGLVNFVLPLISMIIYTLYMDSVDLAMESRRLARLNRFFSSFSHINVAVIDTFCDRVFDRAISTLKGIHIEKIELRVHECDKYLQNRITKLVRENGIKYISILCYELRQERLQEFLTNVVKLGATVNIYERVNHTSELYKGCFNRPVEFWDKMKARLAKDGITLTVTTRGDDDFTATTMTHFVKAHIACMPIGSECHDDSERVRGVL